MPYCTRQNMIDRYGELEILQLTDRDDTGIIDDQVLTQAIDDASAEIDGYLGGRYQLPLANVPSVLEHLACNIARYHLWADGASEAVKQRRDEAVKFLTAIAAGRVSLGLSDSGTRATPSDGAQMESGGRIFGRDQGGFI